MCSFFEVSKLPSNHLLFNFPEGISQRAQYSLNVLSFCLTLIHTVIFTIKFRYPELKNPALFVLSLLFPHVQHVQGQA